MLRSCLYFVSSLLVLISSFGSVSLFALLVMAAGCILWLCGGEGRFNFDFCRVAKNDKK